LSANWDNSTDNESGIYQYQYAIGTTAGGTSVANGATLQLQGGLSFAAENLTIGSGSSISPLLQNVSGDNTWTGPIETVGQGTYARISSDANLLTLANAIAGNDPATSVVLQGAGNILVSGKITGPSGVFSGSVGAGTRTLSNMANDFSGNLNISGGTLKLGASGVIPDGNGTGNVVFSATATTSATATALPIVPSYTWYNFTLPDAWATVSGMSFGAWHAPATKMPAVFISTGRSFGCASARK
jgi:autotransporter-associated beta strand protein